ncbi:hypothetical protein MFLAVUS_005602 [Mucor flavus]|uniref:Uncharacterized protein n=1 Tax=Mucor flavus TaxID=439312 RepID=A0ABP9YZ68_9FUNG
MNWSHVRLIPGFQHYTKNKKFLTVCDTSSVAESDIDALDSLGSIGQVLGISQTELSNYYTAITKVSMIKMHKQIQDDKLNQTDHALNQWQQQMTLELTHMKAILSKLQCRRRDDNKSEQMINPNKSQYLILEKKYNDLNIQTRLNHLNHLDLKSSAIESDLLTKSDLLASYLDLPANIALASVKFRETEDELHELEAKREYLLSDMADLN